jgi:hypothetical protein
MAANQLVTTPRPLHHLDGLAVCEACVALRAGVRRRDQGLVSLPVGTAEEVGEKAAGLRHGKPGVSAGGRVVEGAAAHLDASASNVAVSSMHESGE